MRSLTIQSVAFAMLFCMIHPSAMATGESEDGISQECQEFSNYMGKLAVTLVKVGQDIIDKTNPIINAKELVGIVKKSKCTPSEDLDRVTRSDPKTVETKLHPGRYKGLSLYRKLKHASHELSVLARYEASEQYFVSDDLFQIVYDSNKLDLLKAEMVSRKNGVTTYFRPHYIAKDQHFFIFSVVKKAGGNSVCQFLGHRQLAAGDKYGGSWANSKPWFIKENISKGRTVDRFEESFFVKAVRIGEGGHIANIMDLRYNYRDHWVLGSISCKD